MNAEATVLKLYPLGEKRPDCRLVHGRRPYQDGGKSARKTGSPFAGRLDIFYQCRMQWTQAKKGDLHTLTSADLLSPRLALRKSYLRLSAAGYFARLFLQMLEPDTPIPDFTTCCKGPTPTWKTMIPRYAPSCTSNRNSPGCME